MADRTKQLEKMLEGFHTLRGSLAAGRRALPSRLRLTGSQWVVLNFVAHEQPISVKGISEALRITSSAATQIIGELLKGGSVVKRTDPHDRRSTLISVSPQARKELATMRSIMVRHLDTLLSALSDREFATYLRLHEKIIRHARSS